ncbi:ATP-binding cassette domain-containing protein [bacterium]|nr:ATP-binding cassette domain-containing protein [candidate division CSSED10-310 bacterium]
MIEVTNLTKFYGEYRALSDVSFDVKKGEILGFLGPNAAGKTTTMRIITCFMPATAGSVKVAGFDVFDDAIEVRKRIGYLPESVPLYRGMTVDEYLSFVAEAKRVPRIRRSPRRETVVEQCGLGEVRGKLISTLSKGFRQRVGLAQALINEPEVIILDEPTIGLDPRQIVEIRKLIRSLGGEHTVILSSHILPEVAMTCGRVVIINRGKVVAEDTPENLSVRHGGSGRITMTVDGDPQRVTRVLREVDGVRTVSPAQQTGSISVYTLLAHDDCDVRREAAAAVVNAGFGLLELKSMALSLEEVFVQLVTEEEAAINANARTDGEVR